MNRPIVVVVACMAFTASCATPHNSTCAFARSEWTNAERQILTQVPVVNHPRMQDSVWRATCVSDNAVNHTCLQYFSMGTFLSAYHLCVFGANGTLVQYTEVSVPERFEPRRVLSFAPLKIEFYDPTGDRGLYIGTSSYTTEEYLRHLKVATEQR